jgi:starch-binding outer membrane protein, SusD/RagB family
MNRRRYYTGLLTISTLLAGYLLSCSDEFFDAEMGDRITPSQHYNSEIDADLSYAGCFVYLQDIAENLVLVDGLRSDQMDVTANSDRDMIDINRHDLSADNPYIDPSGFYKLIININEVLPYLPQILEKDRDFDSTILNLYNGALITMRSWAYFMLAKLNGEVGLVDGNLSTVDPSNPPVYLKKNEIIDKLIQELLQFVDENDIYRYPFDHYVLLGELYLEKNQYWKAAEYLKYAIDGPYYTRSEYMVDNSYGEEGWKDIFLNSTQQGSTVIIGVPYSFQDGQKNSLEEWMNIKFDYMVKPTASLLNRYYTEVPRGDDVPPQDNYRGLGITFDTTVSGIPYINKYSIDKGIAYSADIILYRAADVHLLLAEALNRTGQPALALALLNDGFAALGNDRPAEFIKWGRNRGVRSRVYLKNITVPAGVNQMEYIEDLIIQERALELAFEGKRWFDLVRIASRRGNPAYLADKVASKFEDPATAELVRNKLMDPSNWYLPIPKVK